MPWKYRRSFAASSPNERAEEEWREHGARYSPHGFRVLGAVRFVGDQRNGYSVDSERKKRSDGR